MTSKLHNVKLHNIAACVFDAYGTLFDVNTAARVAQDALGEKWQPLAELWRAKQLQYTWLRSLTRCHTDFWQLTADALDFAMATFHLVDPALRARLMDLYLSLSAYPEVASTLRRLKAAGIKLAILSNGTPAMLASAAAGAGIANLLDAVLSVEEVQIYKPHASVYALACARFNASGRPHLLRLFQWLGRLLRKSLWFPRRVVQPHRPASRAPSRNSRRTNHHASRASGYPPRLTQSGPRDHGIARFVARGGSGLGGLPISGEFRRNPVVRLRQREHNN